MRGAGSRNGAANDPWRSTTTARAVRVRELPRASSNNVKKTPEAPGVQILQIQLLEPNTKEVSNHRPPERFAGFYANYAKRTFRAMHGDFS